MLVNPAFSVSAKETEKDLVKITTGELGFNDGARRDQIYARAKELGLELCPAEVGPQLRLQYQDQPNDEMLLVAMEPIKSFVFSVERSTSGRWLSWEGDGNWSPRLQWVFCPPRN